MECSEKVVDILNGISGKEQKPTDSCKDVFNRLCKVDSDGVFVGDPDDFDKLVGKKKTCPTEFKECFGPREESPEYRKERLKLKALEDDWFWAHNK
jgi:hypothetical protein